MFIVLIESMKILTELTYMPNLPISEKPDCGRLMKTFNDYYMSKGATETKKRHSR